MAGYQTIEALRPILHRGPPAMPVVDRALVGRVDEPAKAPPQPPAARVKVDGKYALAPSVVAEIVARRERGESYRMICAALRVSSPSVKRYAGHVAPPPGGWRSGWDTGARTRIKRNKAFADRLRRSGFSFQGIADELGCCLSEAVRLIRNNRKRRKGRGPVSIMVQRVAAASGIACALLRRGDFEAGGQSKVEIAKARHIVFWLVRTRHHEMSFARIGGSLGGFDHATIHHGFYRAAAVAERIGVGAQVRPLTAARRLWAADWTEARPC